MSKKKAKLSAREKWAQKTGQPKENYPGSSSKKSKGYSDIVDSVLKNTPAFQPVAQDFESLYTPELQQEDQAQAEANVKPYFQEQITRELEDLNAFVNTENVNYDRSLRRARFSLATQGGAIGSERTTAEGEITSDHQKTVNEKLRMAERDMGTANLTAAGYATQGRELKGDTVDKMQSTTSEWQNWFKQQRSDRYDADVNRMYATESNDMMKGKKKKSKKKSASYSSLTSSAASLQPSYVNPLQTPA